MTDREQIIQRLDYLSEHPEEETFDSRSGYAGDVSTWTNRRELERELSLANILVQIEKIDDKVTLAEQNHRRMLRFIRAFDEWRLSPSPEAFQYVIVTRGKI